MVAVGLLPEASSSVDSWQQLPALHAVRARWVVVAPWSMVWGDWEWCTPSVQKWLLAGRVAGTDFGHAHARALCDAQECLRFHREQPCVESACEDVGLELWVKLGCPLSI